VDWQRDQRGRTPHTLYTYRTTLQRFLDHLGPTPLHQVSLSSFEAWLQRPRNGRAHGRGGAAATLSKEVTMLRTFYRWLHARGEIGRDPTNLLSAPTVRNVHPKPIGDDDWVLLYEAADDVERVVLGLGFFGGLRRKEITELRGCHVDVMGQRLVGFKRKGGGDDVVPLGTLCRVHEEKLPHLWRSDFLPLVRDLATARCGTTFLLPWADACRAAPRARRLQALDGDQLDPQHINRAMARICARALLPRLTPHQLRHSCATNLLRAGVPIAVVSRLLNHAQLQTTLHYARLGSDELASWLVSTT
jgi:integrase